MRTVYACVLDVAVRSPETSAQGFERLWTLATQWVETIYRERWKTEFKVVPNALKAKPMPFHSFLAQREQVSGVCELVTLEWSYPDDQDTGMQWIVGCQLARNGPRLEASAAVKIVSTHPIAKPLSYTLKRPSLVDLMFVEDFLCAPDRWLPIVAISPEQGKRDYLVKPEDLQQTLLGHAQVVAFRDVSAGRAWTDALKNKELSCYLGACRLYWPGFNLKSKPVEHPLYLADSIRWHTENQQPLSQHLFRTLVAVSGFRFSNPPIARLVKEAIEGEKHANFEKILEQWKSTAETRQFLEELERAWDEVEQLKQERDQARNQLSEVTRDLESQKAAWTAAFRGGTRPAAAVPVEAAPKGPITSVMEAAERARDDFPATLVFLPTALEAAHQSPYRFPDRVYGLFQALDELTHRWQESGSIGSGWHQALKPKGFDYAEFISPTAKGKFGDEYTFNYEGRQIMCEHHVTIGARSADPSCIEEETKTDHWFRDEPHKRLIVGWCGKHLSNTQS